MLRLLKQLSFLFAAVALLLGFTLGLRLQGHVYADAFYARFTTPPAGSLILGTSRAAQALQPAGLQARLGGRYQGPWLNYAFTVTQSPYGPAYLSSIRRKLAPATRRGLFILAVDPWALSQPRPPRQPETFAEDGLLLGQLREVSQHPNLEYLLRQYQQPYYRLLLPAALGNSERLHPDGWLEIARPSPQLDTAWQRRREADKLKTYRQLAAGSYPSPARLASLRVLIGFLQAHGRVVLVRLPTGARMAALERAYQPNFDQRMQGLGVPYFNYLDQPYLTTDGNHLWRGEAPRLTARVAQDIKGIGY